MQGRGNQPYQPNTPAEYAMSGVMATRDAAVQVAKAAEKLAVSTVVPAACAVGRTLKYDAFPAASLAASSAYDATTAAASSVLGSIAAWWNGAPETGSKQPSDKEEQDAAVAQSASGSPPPSASETPTTTGLRRRRPHASDELRSRTPSSRGSHGDAAKKQGNGQMVVGRQ